MLAGLAFAQSPSDINLHLNKTRGLKHAIVPGSGEFRLSLGSQMFSDENTGSSPERGEQGRFASAISDLSSDADADSRVNNSRSFLDRSSLQLRNQRGSSQKRLAPVITLNNSYENNAIGFNDSASSGLSIGGGNGKLQVYGEYEQRHTPQIQIESGVTERHMDGLRGATIDTSAADDSNQPDSREKNAALASRYYLEAVYSFKPNLKGKVSFKRSMIDTFESEEKLQVEGIVEANRNILIKAGYNNEVRPEVTEPRTNKDTKVWTEFILKF